MSVKNLPTLKGVFPGPKPAPKRDFLRENKLKLRDLQNRSQRPSENGDNKMKAMRRHKSMDRVTHERRLNSGYSCGSQKTASSVEIGDTVNMNSTRSKSICDKSIQTDDIQDEEFLYSALKRCSSIDLQNHRENLEIETPKNLLTNGCASTERSQVEFHEPLMDLENNLKNLYIDNDMRLPSSYSDGSIAKKRPARSQADIKSRSDIRLPKYLEREKREKEERRQREINRDPHCPDGYYALDETDREIALSAAKKKFQSLVNELNRMPMTSETLRLRSRKVEIERELLELENDIRIFSKPKVYVLRE